MSVAKEDGRADLDRAVTVAVKLAGWREVTQATGTGVRPSTRKFLSDDVAGLWARNILQHNESNWLLNVILRIDAIRNSKADSCLVLCGGGYDLMVLLNDAPVPQSVFDVPNIGVSVALAVQPDGKFVEEDPVQHYGAAGPFDNIRDHLLSAMKTGHSNSDCAVFVESEANYFGLLNEGSIEDKRIVRLHVRRGTWQHTGPVEVKKFDAALFTRMSDIKEEQQQALEPTTASPQHPQEEHEVAEDSEKHSSCYYAPFCMKTPSECGGFRSGGCSLVNQGIVKIPTAEEFLAEKKRYKNELKRKRRTAKKAKRAPSATEANEVATASRIEGVERAAADNKGDNGKMKATSTSRDGGLGYSTSESTVTEYSKPDFNPKQYLLLEKAFHGKLTAEDLKDDGEKFTTTDWNKASEMLLKLEHEFDDKPAQKEKSESAKKKQRTSSAADSQSK